MKITTAVLHSLGATQDPRDPDVFRLAVDGKGLVFQQQQHRWFFLPRQDDPAFGFEVRTVADVLSALSASSYACGLLGGRAEEGQRQRRRPVIAPPPGVE